MTDMDPIHISLSKKNDQACLELRTIAKGWAATDAHTAAALSNGIMREVEFDGRVFVRRRVKEGFLSPALELLRSLNRIEEFKIWYDRHNLCTSQARLAKRFFTVLSFGGPAQLIDCAIEMEPTLTMRQTTE